MKTRILATIAAVMLAATTVISAAYPSSPEWDHPLPADGKILIGEFYGTDPWGDPPNMANTADKAWDGDESTFFDPATGKTDTCYTAVKLDQAYTLTEIRIMPRGDQLPRFIGATIQGSNDGENWTDVLINLDEAVNGQDFYRFTPDTFEAGSNTGYSYYRYINLNDHGDVADIELYGNAAVAETPAVVEETPAVVEEAPAPEVVEVAPAEAAPAPVVTVAPATGDSFALIASALALAIVSTYVVMRKKIER